MENCVSVDFETYYKDGEYSLKTQGQRSYVYDARFNPYLISVSDGKESWAGEPKHFNWAALEGKTLLAHNRAFDELVYRRMVELNLAPKINYANWFCTASLSVYLCMRRDLLRAVEYLLGVTVDKSYRLDADGKNWDDIVKAGSAEKVLAAGRSDALRCWQLWNKFGHLWPQLERDLSDMTIRQCHRGCQIDVPKLERYKLITQTALIQAEAALPWMKEGKKPTSPKAIAEECRKEGIPCPPVKSRDGEEAYDEWEKLYAPKFQWVRAFASYRKLNKFLSILETVESRLFDGGQFPYDLLYFGAHTGRWSGSGGYNVQNQRKEPLLIDGDGWLIEDDDRLKEVAKFLGEQEGRGVPLAERKFPDFVQHVLDVRALKIPRPGKKMFAPDLSQIEPRVLAWLVNDRPMLDSMAAGVSPYEAHARATMGWTGGDMKKESKKLYALAKARVLGLGFQCGWERFIEVAMNLAGVDITEDDPESIHAEVDGQLCYEKDGSPKMVSGYGYNSKRVVREYRESNPLIAGEHGIWKRLDEAFKASAGGTFEMTLPSGRKLRYPDVKWERKPVPDEENPKKVRYKNVCTALAFNQKYNRVMRTPFYGGILTENLVQATARDVFGELCVKLDKTPGINVLWTVHDEAVIETDPDVTVKDIKHIMSQTPAWIPGLPVASDVAEIPHYCK
jgi:hypothetical protein